MHLYPDRHHMLAPTTDSNLGGQAHTFDKLRVPYCLDTDLGAIVAAPEPGQAVGDGAYVYDDGCVRPTAEMPAPVQEAAAARRAAFVASRKRGREEGQAAIEAYRLERIEAQKRDAEAYTAALARRQQRREQGLSSSSESEVGTDTGGESDGSDGSESDELDADGQPKPPRIEAARQRRRRHEAAKQRRQRRRASTTAGSTSRSFSSNVHREALNDPELDAMLARMTPAERAALRATLRIELRPRPNGSRNDRWVTTPDGHMYRSDKSAMRHVLACRLAQEEEEEEEREQGGDGPTS